MHTLRNPLWPFGVLKIVLFENFWNAKSGGGGGGYLCFLRQKCRHFSFWPSHTLLNFNSNWYSNAKQNCFRRFRSCFWKNTEWYSRPFVWQTSAGIPRDLGCIKVCVISWIMCHGCKRGFPTRNPHKTFFQNDLGRKESKLVSPCQKNNIDRTFSNSILTI